MMLIACGAAQADRRAYVWTYEYLTMPQGQAELEYYVTSKVPDTGDFDGNNVWEHYPLASAMRLILGLNWGWNPKEI